MIRLIIFILLLFGACGYALWRGRTDARLIAAGFFIGTFATFFLREEISGGYTSVEAGIFAVDMICLAIFIYAALISDRFWPLWISGLQLTTSFGHILKAINSDLVPIAYAASLRFWAYPILLILAIGVWRADRRSNPQIGAATRLQSAPR